MTRQRFSSKANPAEPATALAAAQEQLQRRRRQRRQERISNQLPVHTDAHGRLLSPPPHQESARQPGPAATECAQGVPWPAQEPSESWPSDATSSATGAASTTPLRPGWESESLSLALEAAQRRRQAAANQAAAIDRQWLPSSSVTPPPSPVPLPDPEDATVRLHPDVGLAMLREDQAAVGRIWLLLRHLDRDGQGWVTLERARKQLTGKQSPLRVCGWRQLRNLLARGDGLFWNRDPLQSPGGRIWMRSVSRVAASLELDRLRIHPVALPVDVLLQSIGVVRAHFYASFHSGRSEEAPISRSTLRGLSSVSRRTQRKYEQRAGVKQHPNWAIGPNTTSKEAQERAWRHGRACFQFTDRRGKQGKPGTTYLAWQLPNSYTGPHALEARGRQKQINRELVDLFMKGITGNGKHMVDGKPHTQQTVAPPHKCFYGDGQAAVRGYSNTPENDAYWKSPHKESRGSVWHLIPGGQNGA